MITTKDLSIICDKVADNCEAETNKLIQTYIKEMKVQMADTVSHMEQNYALIFLRNNLVEAFNNAFQVALIQECKFENELLKFNR